MVAASRKKTKKPSPVPAAIIGMACLFPGSAGLKAYWQLLMRGRDAITDIPETHWSAEAYYDPDPKQPDHVYCTRGAFLPAVAFDPSEFGIPPHSLEAIDTSQLLALMTARDALSNAGYGSGKTFDREHTSVVLGVTGTQEMVIPLGARLGHPLWREALLAEGIPEAAAERIVNRISDAYVPWQENSFPGLLGNVVAGRICNRLDLGGTNCVVDAACASSMSAVHLALLELQSGRSDMVITGGVDTLNDIFMHMCFSKTMTLSRTGDIRPFSRDADGTILGEGIGMLVLKPLPQAEKDGDHIHAVIKSIGSSSDGRSQSIYAPRAAGQAKALRKAYALARIEPSTIGLVEAHGTGTSVGDRVEMDALKTVFGPGGENHKTTAVGSVKSMIGHTKAAAGSAGLIKTALALENKVLPPTLKAETPDPDLDLDASPFYINSSPRPWVKPPGHPRRAAVSSFGFGGSNFHLVLEEYASRKTAVSWDGSVEIFAFSGQNRQAVSAKLDGLAEALDRAPDDPGHINRLAAGSRRGFTAAAPCRLVFVYEMMGDMQKDVDQLRRISRTAFHTLASNSPPGGASGTEHIFFSTEPKPGKLAFVFPGQGSQYLNMGRDLCCLFPEALNAMEMADTLADPETMVSASVFPAVQNNAENDRRMQKNLNRTDIAQPAIGAVSLAMFEILQRLGIHPEAVCGHSYGELTALHAAGRVDRGTLVRLSAIRGRAMAAASGIGPRGAMLAVKAPFSEMEDLVADLLGVVLANINSPRQCVLSGPAEGIERAEKRLREMGRHSVRLAVSAAFHSPLIQAAQKTFEKAVQEASWMPGNIPVFANSSGEVYAKDPDRAKSILAQQMLLPVHFVDVIENMHAAGVHTFVEVGPRNVLTGLVKSTLGKRAFRAMALDASCGRKYGLTDLACVVSELAAMGYPVRLDQWEDKVPDAPKRRMTVMLNGANYRSDAQGPGLFKKSTPPVSAPLNGPAKRPVDEPESILRGSADVVRTAPDSSRTEKKPDNSIRNKMKKSKKTTLPETAGPSYVNHALQAVAQGLKSMQALQAGTAEAHQKFLETQAEAGRMLQRMLESTRRLADIELGAADVAPQVREKPDNDALLPAGAAIASPNPSVEFETIPKPSPRPPSSGPSLAEPQATLKNGPKPSAPVIAGGGDDPSPVTSMVSETLLTVVSELTGYPADMLNMDMDIEADLGIDSIKRVEILSSLEERLPDLPSVEPDTMATLKTLEQIVAYLGQTSATPAPIATDGRFSGSSEETKAQPPAMPPILADTLLTVVSELTGYPIDMLNMDMDIEADLGIDSIKRVEILSTLEEKLPGIPEVTPEMLAGLKTLGQIADYLTGTSDGTPLQKDGAEPTQNSDPAGSDVPLAPHAPSFAVKAVNYDASPLAHQYVKVQETPRTAGQQLTLKPGTIYILEDSRRLAEALAGAFKAHGIEAVIMTRSLVDDILLQNQAVPRASGLIIPAGEAKGSDQEADRFLKDAFRLVQSMAGELVDTGEGSNTLLATITRLDGAFGFKGTSIAQPALGGLAGLLKTAALEWPGVVCRAFDIDPEWNDPAAIAETVIDELLRPTPADPLEIGLAPGSRYTLALEDLPARQDRRIRLGLGQNDVVVVTGGARGVTAAAALELARHSGARMVLWGRSDPPADEPMWLQGLTAPADIKRAIRENEFNNNGASPRDIERSFVRHMANREIRATVSEFSQIGIDMRYMPVDIRDPNTVAAAMDDIHGSMGPVTAIVHGAGVIEDRLIVDKTPEQLDLVFDTKVRGLRNLLDAASPTALKHLVVFSSISARNGNSGQADYAMANETLNKLAADLAARNKTCHVLSINWGPWDGGMVTPPLKKMFKNQGIGLIPLEEGARSMVVEMGLQTHGHPVEIVIGSMAPTLPAAAAPRADGTPAEPLPQPPAHPENPSPLALSFKKEIDTHTYPILADHVIGGKPVVPFALIAEWFGHGALHENPGLVLHGIDDMRILKGVRLDARKKLIRLFAGKPSRKDGHFEVSLELRDGVMEGRDVIHSRGKAILTDTVPAAPEVDIARFHIGGSYPKSVQDVYNDILFHGMELRGIKEILACSSRGMVARVSSAPSPSRWIKDHLRSGWIADPLVLDCAFQLATVWCYEETGNVSLPSYCASYRQYCSSFPTEGVTALLEVTDLSDHKMTGNFLLVDKDKRLAAQLTGYEAILDPSLFKAFKPQKS